MSERDVEALVTVMLLCAILGFVAFMLSYIV